MCRFARESFRLWVISPWVVSPWVNSLVGRFAPIWWVVSPIFFIQFLRIEVRYVLVYKGVEGEGGGVGMGSLCAFGYSSGLFIPYLLLMSFIL